MTEPLARRSHPETAHNAAASIPLSIIEQTRIALLLACYRQPPMRDDEIVARVQSKLQVSGSGIRTRRHHRTVGVAPAGYDWFECAGKSKNASGRWCKTWQLTDTGQAVAEQVADRIYTNVRGSDK